MYGLKMRDLAKQAAGARYGSHEMPKLKRKKREGPEFIESLDSGSSRPAVLSIVKDSLCSLP